jgi:hypothetical protein
VVFFQHMQVRGERWESRAFDWAFANQFRLCWVSQWAFGQGFAYQLHLCWE